MKTAHWVALLVFAASGCERDDWGAENLAHGVTPTEISKMRRGRDVYATYCVGCHGTRGDGKGPAAEFLDPKPRDFRTCRMKFAQVPANELPRDEDFLHVMTNGLAGTAMTAFRFVPQEDLRALVAYLATFCKDLRTEPRGVPIRVEEDPWQDNPKRGVAMGERYYHGIAQCWSCHPAYATRSRIAELRTASKLKTGSLRDRLYEPETKPSSWGAPIRAPDFLDNRVKTGIVLSSLARVIGAGVGGTAMPTWVDSLNAEQLWGLAYYVRSIARMRGSDEARALKAKLNGKANPASQGDKR